jgi:hypothetical protein
VASLLDGCEIVLARPSGQATAQIRKRLEAALRRRRGVLLVAGDWPGAPVRLRVTARRWTGLGDGHGRLRACLAEVTPDGRGEAAMLPARWLWLPAEDDTVTVADPVDIPMTDRSPAGSARGLRAASASGGRAGLRPGYSPGMQATRERRLARPHSPTAALLDPPRDRLQVSPGIPAQPRHRHRDRLLKTSLGESLRQASHLSEQIGAPGGELAQRRHSLSMLIGG